MNLRKRKHFTRKKEDSFPMSLFLSPCFSFQTRTDLVLVKLYFNGAVRHFLKTFIKFEGKRLWWKPFLGKFKLLKWTQVRTSFYSQPFYGCFQTLKRNAFLWMITFVWCKYSIVIKDLSKSGSFFSLNAPKYLGARLFYSLYEQPLHIFRNVYIFFIFLLRKSMDWFLYDIGLRHERVN